MKIIELKVYKLSELSDSAQTNAHNNYIINLEQYDADEAIESIKSYLDFFGLSVKNYSLSTYGRSFFDYDDNNIRNVKPKDVPNYFAGTYVDSVFYDSFMHHAKKNGDIKNAIRHAVDDCVSATIRQMEYEESYDSFYDMSEANEWHYLANGELYHD